MTWGTISPLVATGGLTLNVLTQLGICRLTGGRRFTLSIAAASIVGLIPIVCFVMYVYISDAIPLSHAWPILAVHFITYAALSYNYFAFVNLAVTSLRIRLLSDVAEANGRLTLNQVLRRYNGRDILRARIRRLLEKRQLVLRDQRYVIGNRLLLCVAGILDMAKVVLLRKRLAAPARPWAGHPREGQLPMPSSETGD